MKNNVLARILITVAFFMYGILFSCLDVNASSITASAETLEISSVFFSDLIRLGFLSGGVFPQDTPISDFADYMDNEYSLIDAYDVNLSDINIYPAPSGWLDNLNQSIGDIYGQNGIITSDSDIYIGHIDNGYFQGDFYCDADGNLLASDSSMATFLFNARYGGDTFSNSLWQQFYADFISDLNENSLVYSPDNLSVNSVFILCGGNVYDRNLIGNLGSIYFPYGFIKGRCIPDPSWTSSSNSTSYYRFYVTSLDECIINSVWKSSTGYPSAWTYDYYSNGVTVNGDTYYYRITTNNLLKNTWDNPITYDEFFEKRNSSFTRYLIQSYGISTSAPTILNTDDDFVSFTTVGNGDSSLDLTDDFDLTNTTENISTLDDADKTYNQDFSTSYPISIANPSLIIPDDDVNVIIGAIPFPDVIPDEGDTTANPALTYDETIQPEFSVAIDSFQNLEIPFITNLQNRYPFSIPWDIARFIERFRNDPLPPAWDFDWKITVGNTTYIKHFEGDLSDFNGLAEIFRNLILISFIVALCKFSYDHHF